MMELRNGEYDNKHSFTLLDYDGNGNVISIQYSGCYVIVDNGYMSWSTTIPPMKDSNSRSEIRFLEWLESLRKDVECAFGILKKRWMILKHGIRLHGIYNCDKIWLTCCALYNMLLDTDNLNETRDPETDTTPFAVERLNNPGRLDSHRMSDVSGNGIGNDCEFVVNTPVNENLPVVSCPNNSGIIKVNDLSMVELRKRLIRHFNICFIRNEIKWPSNNKI